MEKIFDEYYFKIYHWSLKKTKNKEDAEDLTNNIFVAVFEYFNKDIAVHKIENLIWKIAYNIWCTRAKKYIKEKNNIPLEYNTNVVYEENTLDKIIYKEILTNLDDINLTEKELLSFKLYYMQDLSIEQISKIIGTTSNNIKYYLYNARKKIKEKYKYE